MASCPQGIPPPYLTNEHEPPPPYKADWINMHDVNQETEETTNQTATEDVTTASNNQDPTVNDPWLIPPESRDPREPITETVYGPIHEHQSLLGVPSFQAPPSYSSLDVSLPCPTVSTIEACPPAYPSQEDRQCSHISLVDSFELYGQIALVDGDGQPVRFGQVKVSRTRR